MKDNPRGWTGEEDAALLRATDAARRQRLPLKNAFDAVAVSLHRRPNSVRNHYYSQLKPAQDSEPAFRPFSEEETDRLLETVLLAQAKGQSVRACTLEMADGDTRGMLRYQNKYRALLKAQSDKVLSVRSKLISQGYAVPDPFVRDPGSPHVGRPPKASRELERGIRALLDTLYRNLLALTQGDAV